MYINVKCPISNGYAILGRAGIQAVTLKSPDHYVIGIRGNNNIA